LSLTALPASDLAVMEELLTRLAEQR